MLLLLMLMVVISQAEPPGPGPPSPPEVVSPPVSLSTLCRQRTWFTEPTECRRMVAKVHSTN